MILYTLIAIAALVLLAVLYIWAIEDAKKADKKYERLREDFERHYYEGTASTPSWTTRPREAKKPGLICSRLNPQETDRCDG